MQGSYWRNITLICFMILLLGGILANVRLWQTKTRGEDVFYAWVEGQRLKQGENPYARVLSGNMRDNDKYATYFPVFYYASLLAIEAGLTDYEQWIVLWRVVFLLANLGIAAILFYLPFRRKAWILALFASAFWLFGRWTLHVTQIAQLDFLAILPLLASIALFTRHRYAALLFLSLSIGVKQIGLFMIPLYLIWVWQETECGRARELLIAVALIASIPLLSSLPFLIWNPEALAKSVIFDAVRNPADHFSAPSFDASVGWVGLPAKTPMVVLMILVFVLAWQRYTGKWTSTLLVMMSFLDFSSVLFRQYFVWAAPFVPLAVLDLLGGGVPRAAPGTGAGTR